MRAAIVSIGDELLIGQTVNTNAAWLGSKLTDVGIRIEKVYTISDHRFQIMDTFTKCEADGVDFVFITGGLGPTKDDITKKVFCEYFGVSMVKNDAVLQNVKRIFKAYNRPVRNVNKDQALVPLNAEVFINKKGTAPGMWMNKGNVAFISMPGVPTEMEYLMNCEIIPKIQLDYNLPAIYRKTLLTQGVGESDVAEMIEDIEDELPPHISLAYLPSAGMVKLRLTGFGKEVFDIKEQVHQKFDAIQKVLQDYVFGWDNETLEEIVVRLLQNHQQSLALAESLTGGSISALIASIPGVSAVYKGGVTAYQNEIKEKLLGVSKANIQEHTAVSLIVAEAMAKGAQNLMGSDWALSTTGIAGPDGGSDEIPVGTVCIAVAQPNGTVLSEKFSLGEGRSNVVIRSQRTALNFLRKALVHYHSNS